MSSQYDGVNLDDPYGFLQQPPRRQQKTVPTHAAPQQHKQHKQHKQPKQRKQTLLPPPPDRRPPPPVFPKVSLQSRAVSNNLLKDSVNLVIDIGEKILLVPTEGSYGLITDTQKNTIDSFIGACRAFSFVNQRNQWKKYHWLQPEYDTFLKVVDNVDKHLRGKLTRFNHRWVGKLGLVSNNNHVKLFNDLIVSIIALQSNLRAIA